MQIKRFEAKTMTAALRWSRTNSEWTPSSLRPDAAPERRLLRCRPCGRSEVTAAKDSGWSVYNAAGRKIPDPAEPARRRR